MQEAPYLENHRFLIHDRSLAMIRSLRDNLVELNKEFKLISGLSFFGSRTKGLENEYNPNKPDKLGSDFDFCVFYDGTAFGREVRADEPLPREILVIDPVTKGLRIDSVKARHFRDLQNARHHFEADLQHRCRETVLNSMDNQINQEGKSIFIVDISKDATSRALEEFYASVQMNEGHFSDENVKLLSRFFLGVGDGLYSNRLFILDHLQKRPDGEKLFKILMQRLGEFERTRDNLPEKPSTDATPYGSYPTTIEEAKKYFLTRQY